MRRATELSEHGIEFIDIGISGGVWGLVHGFCLMVGGPDAAVKRLEPAFRSLTPAEDVGYCHFGPNGAGHYVKMVHNGVEYALMQSYAEGFELLAAKDEFDLDLSAVAETWLHGSVVRSWLLELDRRGAQGRPGVGKPASIRRGFRGGPLDGAGVRGSRRSHTGHYGGIAAAFPLPPGRAVGREAAGRPPAAVRRPRRKTE